MAKKTEEEVFSEWSSKISKAEAIHKQRVDEWEKYYEYYRLEQDQTLALLKGEALPDLWVNYQFGLTRVILPSIYYRNPDPNVLARRKQFLPFARLSRELLRYQLEELEFESEIRLMVLDTLVCGSGWAKIGYAPLLQRKKKLSSEEEQFYSIDEILGLEEAEEETFGSEQHVTSKHPFCLRVSPYYILLDPLATKMSNARWVIHKILRPVEELLEDSRYDSSLVSGIQGTRTLTEERYLNEVVGAPGYADKRDKDLVMTYEIWDIVNRKVYFMDEWNMLFGDKRFLLKRDWPYKMDGFPFIPLVFNEDPWTPYGVSDYAQWHNPSEAINWINARQFSHIARFNRKYGYDEGRIRAEEIGKLQTSEEGAIIATQGSPNEIIQPLQDAPLSPDVYALRNELRNELTFLSGVTEQRRGETFRSKTATEASIMEQQARIRDSDRLVRVAQFFERTLRNFLQLDVQVLSVEEVSRIVGPELGMFWVTGQMGNIKDELQVKVRVGSTAYLSKEVQVKQLIDLLNVAGQIPDPMTGAPTTLNLREIVKRIVEKMIEEDPEGVLLPPTPPSVGAPGPPGAGGPPQSGPPRPPVNRRSGTGNMGDMLSTVQNMGVRRKPPNPTAEMGLG